MDCELPMRSCLFTPAVHFHGAQQSKNDLALWCCRNTSNNKTAKAAQRVWVHIELSKACCRHPIQELQSNSFGPDSPFLMSLITDDKCSLHIEGFIYKQQFVNTEPSRVESEHFLVKPGEPIPGFPMKNLTNPTDSLWLHRKHTDKRAVNAKGNKTFLKAALFSS